MYKKIKPEILTPDIILYSDIVYSNQFSDFLQESIPLEISILRPFYKIQEWEELPLFIWFTGGAFRCSTPLRNIPELVDFAKKGYVVASVDYRVSSESLFPAPVQDAKTAVRFLKTHHKKYGIDPERIVVGGHSAGGYIAAMLAATDGVELFETEEWQGVSSAVKGAVCMSSGDTLVEGNPLRVPGEEVQPMDLLMGYNVELHPERAKVGSITRYLSDKTAPILMIHGECDEVINVEYARNFYNELEKAGVDADYYEIEGAGHGTVELRQEEIHQIMMDFFERVLD